MKKMLISTDKSKLNTSMIHAYLTDAYWAKGRSKKGVQTTIEHSICFGVYLDSKQIGFARVVSDHFVFAYIMDVFILDEYKGNGYGKKLMNAILTHDDLTAIENWLLRTSDAHDLYRQFGFEELEHAERTMIRRKVNK